MARKAKKKIQKVETVGTKKFSKYMKRHRLSQKEMADLLEISQEAVSRYVNGVSRPNARVAVRIEVLTKGRLKMVDWYSDIKAAEQARAA